MAITRRELLRLTAGGCCLLAATQVLHELDPSNAFGFSLDTAPDLSDLEARWYDKLDHKEVKCRLCPRECVVGDSERGFCGVRENKGGIYRTLVHSRPCSVAVDPVEKKPFFHVKPGTLAFSLATAGCNLNCKFCQNWEISQSRPEQLRNYLLPPSRIADLANMSRAVSLAYTYSEPTVFAEFMLDCAAAGRAKGLLNLMISAGYVQPGPLKEIVAHLDAVKIDLKSFSDDFYRKICRGALKPVLETLLTLKGLGVWVEIVYLVVPTLNDDPKDLKAAAAWIRGNLGPDVPIHFTRFHPQYLLKDLPPTPVERIENAVKIARDAGLNFVYLGNVPGHADESTLCPSCRAMLIRRTGFFIRENNLKGGKCPKCGRAIPGIW